MQIDQTLPAVSSTSSLSIASCSPSSQSSINCHPSAGADYIDTILKGTPPGEPPIERPMDFQFVINRKTARTPDLSLPQSLFMRANRIVD